MSSVHFEMPPTVGGACGKYGEPLTEAIGEVTCPRCIETPCYRGARMAADEIRESIAQDGATHRDGYPDAIDQGETHSEGCWRWKGHHNCAVERVVWFERYQRQMASLVARLRSQVQTLEDLHLSLLRRPVEAAPESDTSQKPHTSLHSDVSGSGDVSEEDEPPSREPLLQVVWRCRSCGAQPGEPGCKECHR